ncbi:MAG: DUF1501 domain-containing protein [Planctomycetes bacterium]|nr:DUF1501 domain-containing protein [Planctomycetota bacterium]MBM4057377.1 DUF1501 domain-containing protein [Planctomycetota bacterium]
MHICLVGGLSHLDSFDPKPALERFHGTKLPSEEQPDICFGQVGLLRQADWTFRPRRSSDLMVSDLFPEIAQLADELTVLRSMESKLANHTPASRKGVVFRGGQRPWPTCSRPDRSTRPPTGRTGRGQRAAQLGRPRGRAGEPRQGGGRGTTSTPPCCTCSGSTTNG